jgi:hypothetical protein
MLIPVLVILSASPIDTAFQSWAVKLPEPKTLSEMNGIITAAAPRSPT